jgi:hypothetical protein
MKCECPNEGALGCPASWYNPVTELPYVNHQPNECRCTNDIRLYKRDGKLLHLCSICSLLGDEPVNT